MHLRLTSRKALGSTGYGGLSVVDRARNGRGGRLPGTGRWRFMGVRWLLAALRLPPIHEPDPWSFGLVRRRVGVAYGGVVLLNLSLLRLAVALQLPLSADLPSSCLFADWSGIMNTAAGVCPVEVVIRTLTWWTCAGWVCDKKANGFGRRVSSVATLRLR